MKKNILILIFILINNLIAQVNVSLPDTSSENKTKIFIPIYVSDLTGYGITSYEFKVNFDGNILDAKNYNLDGTLSNSFTWSFSKRIKKKSIKIEANGLFPISGKGVLIYLEFDVIAKQGRSKLEFDNFKFNDGNPQSFLTDGSIFVFRPVILNVDQKGGGSGSVYINHTLVNLPFEGTFNKDEIVSLEASPDEKSIFNFWEGDIQTEDNPVSVILDTDKKIFANFSHILFQITSSSNPLEGGVTTGGGSYIIGDEVTVSAIANQGWEFVNWTENGNVVSSEVDYKFIADSDRNLVANFKRLIFNIVTSSDPSNAGNTEGDGTYEYGSQVIVSAIANSGWIFRSWNENNQIVSNSPDYHFTVTNDRTLTAKFSRETVNISVNVIPQNGGVINGTGNYEYGNQVTLTAIPNNGWYFINWEENGITVSNEEILSFMAEENRIFTANFSDQVFTVECSSQPAEGGFTSGCGFYAPGQVAVLIAHSNPGWSFKNWTSNEIVISESDTFNFDVTSGFKVVANFSQNLYVVNCSSKPLDGGVTSGCGFFNYGQTAQLKAIANPGYVFDYWSENDSTVSDISNFSFLVNNNRSVTANFKALTGFTDLTKEDIIPGEYFLANAFPNPFNPSTTIKFGIPMQSSVFMFITNIQGKIVRILLKNQSINAGMYIKRFDGDNLASGIYFVTLIAVDLETNRPFVKSKKLMLIK